MDPLTEWQREDIRLFLHRGEQVSWGHRCWFVQVIEYGIRSPSDFYESTQWQEEGAPLEENQDFSSKLGVRWKPTDAEAYTRLLDERVEQLMNEIALEDLRRAIPIYRQKAGNAGDSGKTSGGFVQSGGSRCEQIKSCCR